MPTANTTHLNQLRALCDEAERLRDDAQKLLNTLDAQIQQTRSLMNADRRLARDRHRTRRTLPKP